ncbi:MAG: universal stress protein [Planctomycetes bacterium]|nr:universal stress protein [Planctomycetota bacterium]MCB9918484.1 universal stress protein [Planctomycetota bacterium]
MYQKLLIPIEGGEASKAVVRFAKKLAGKGANARVLNVLVNETTMFYADLLSIDHLTEAANSMLGAMIDEFGSKDFGMDRAIHQGTVEECVLEEVKEWNPDLVVMGSHGRKGFQRLLLGSEVQRVLRHTTKPLCIVKGKAAQRDGELQRIVLATDLGEATGAAREAFADLLRDAKKRGLDIHGEVLHVFESDPWFLPTSVVAVPGGGYSMPVVTSEVEKRIEERRHEIRDELAAIVKPWVDEGLQVTTKMFEGQAWNRIAEYVEQEHVDLLVLGSHHYGGFDRLMLGSIAEKTLRAVECPVLLIPSPEAAD